MIGQKGPSARFVLVSAAALLLWGMGHPALADTIDAASARADFAAGAASGLSPQTPSEYLRCAALWDRWEYFMRSSRLDAFNRDSGPDLSARNARTQAARLRRMARTLAKQWEDTAELSAWTAEGEAAADDRYAAFMTNEAGAARAFVTALGACR